MTKSEKDRRMAELEERKKAITWRYIGACQEIRDQIDILEATPTEDDNGTDQTAEA